MCHFESESLDLVRIQPKSIMNHIVTSWADSALVYELWDYEEVIPVGKQIWLESSNVISDGSIPILDTTHSLRKNWYQELIVKYSFFDSDSLIWKRTSDCL